MRRMIYRAFSLCLILTLLLYTSLSATIAVYAEETEPSTNSGNAATQTNKAETLVDSASVRDDKGNVLSIIGADGDKRGRLKAAIAYNEQVHYIMTYTILKNKYMDNASYSELYKSGKPSEGFDKNITGLSVKMGYSHVLGGENKAETPHEEAEANKESATEATNKEEFEQATEKFAKKVTDKLIRLYAQKYVTLDKHLTDESGFLGGLVDVWGEWTGEKTMVFAAVSNIVLGKSELSYPKMADLENHINTLKNDNPQKLIYDALYEDVLEQLYQGNYSKLFDAKIADSQLAIKYKSTLNYQYKYHRISTLTGDKIGAVYWSDTENPEVATMRKNVAYYPTRGLIAKNHNVDVDKEYAEYLADAGTLKKYKEELSKDYEAWQKLSTAYKEAEKKGQEAVLAENVASLAWIPLDYKAQLEDNKFKELVQLFDGGVIEDKSGRTTILGSTGGARAIQINDLFALKKNTADARKPTASPYLSYKYEEHKNYGIGTAYVGKSTFALNADLGLYSGIKTANLGITDMVIGTVKGIFGKSEYGLAEPLTASEISNNTKQLLPHKYISYLATSDSKVTGITKGSDYIVGIDNYGNIISGSTLQVIVPYWHNTALPYFSNFNSATSYFAATPLLNEPLSGDLANVVKAGNTGKPKENTTINVSSFTVNSNNYSSALSSIGNFGKTDLNGLGELMRSDSQVVQGIALNIVSQTKADVQTWNSKFVAIAEEQGEVYISASDAGRGTTTSDEDLLNKFNAADLLERIQMILDYGFYEIIRLTIVSWVVSFYTGTISNFSLSEIFHTKLITQTDAWQEMLIPIAMLLGAFVGVYMLFLGFRVARNTLPLRSFFMQIVGLTSAIVIPVALYAPIVELALNKPTEKILGVQMEQVGILDNYLYVEGKDREEMDETYKMLFGSEADLRDRSQDYLVTFYTTTHKDGFEIDSVTLDDLSEKNKIKTLEAIETGQWRGTDLVKVKVSVYDLFEWVMDETATNTDLFTWLATNKSERYAQLGEYKEFSTIPEMTRGLSNAPMKSSEVYRMMYNHSSSISDSILGLYSVSQAFQNKENTKEEDKITDNDREAFIRDLAFPGETRQQVYGAANQVSPTTTALWAKYAGGATLPSTDFFNLEETVNKLVPVRDYNSTRLNGDIYTINREVLDNYIVNYSVVRESIGSPSAFKRAEFHAIVLDMWFAVNEKLDIHLAPTYFATDTVSFDNYMRLAFIPMREYADLNNKGLDNVGQYVALRTHPATLLFIFLPMLLLMMIFGFLYLFTFYFLMMLLITVSFIWNYVIKNNMHNKSWLGALVIILSFALAKVGLLVIWRAMSFFLNYAVTSTGDTYPYVLVHALVVSVYLAVAIYLLFTKVFKTVLQDKGNLGGELFADSISKFATSITGALTGKSSGGKSSKDFVGGKGAGNSVRNALNNEGSEGLVKVRKNDFTKNKLEQLAGSGKRIDEDLADINYAIHDDGSVGAGHEFGLRFAGVNDSLHKEAAYTLGETYDSIEAGYVGLSKEQIEALEEQKAIGKVIASSNDGHNITTIDGITEEHTARLRASLEDAGIQVYQDGTELSFNSSAINLANQGVRKALFGNILPSLLDETHKVSQLSEHTVQNTDDITGLGVYHQMSDGRISFKVGDDGLSPKTLAKLMQSDDYKQNFITDEVPMMKDGQYLQGFLVAMPKGKDAYVSAGHISNVVDTELRKSNGIAARTARELKVIDILDTEKGMVYDHLADGMQIQQFDEGKYGIVYEADDKEHRNVAETLKSIVYRKRDHEQESKIDAMQRTMAYINEGGSNGFFTETVNTKLDKNALQSAYAKGLVSNEQSISVYGGERAKELVNAVSQVREVFKADTSKLESYAIAQDHLFRQGDDILLGGSNNYEKALQTMFKFNDKHKVLGEETTRMKAAFSDLRKSLMNMDITETQYTRKSEKLMADMQVIMQRNGNYDTFTAEQIREAIKKTKKPEIKLQYEKILDNYVQSKQKLKEDGIDTKIFSTYTAEDFDRLASYVSNIREVVANEDGTVKITARNNLDAKDVSDLTNTLLGLQSKPNEI